MGAIRTLAPAIGYEVKRIGVWSIQALREAFSARVSANDAQAVTIDPSKVPPDLHGLVPHAQEFGVTDDTVRMLLVERLTEERRKDMLEAIRALECPLLNWLAGPDATAGSPSQEYLAYSCLLRILDDWS